MRIVEGHTNRLGIKVELREGKLKVYPISEAKLKLFRDGGTLIGRSNDWAYTFLTCGISFCLASLSTTNNIMSYFLVTISILCWVISAILFITKKKKKRELSALYNEVISGDI